AAQRDRAGVAQERIAAAEERSDQARPEHPPGRAEARTTGRSADRRRRRIGRSEDRPAVGPRSSRRVAGRSRYARSRTRTPARRAPGGGNRTRVARTAAAGTLAATGTRPTGNGRPRGAVADAAAGDRAGGAQPLASGASPADARAA